MSRSIAVGFTPGVAPWLAIASVTNAVNAARRRAKAWWDAQTLEDRAYLAPLGAAAYRRRHEAVTVAHVPFAAQELDTELAPMAFAPQARGAADVAATAHGRLDRAVRAVEVVGARADFTVRRTVPALTEAPVLLELQTRERALAPRAGRRG